MERETCFEILIHGSGRGLVHRDEKGERTFEAGEDVLLPSQGTLHGRPCWRGERSEEIACGMTKSTSPAREEKCKFSDLLIFQRGLIGSAVSRPDKKTLAICLNVHQLLQSKYFLANFHCKWMLFKNKFTKSLRKEHIEESNYH